MQRDELVESNVQMGKPERLDHLLRRRCHLRDVLATSTVVAIMMAIISSMVGCGPTIKNPISGSAPTETVGSEKLQAGDSTKWKFVERAADSGVRFAYHNGAESNHRSIIESIGGGVAIFDFDRDGWNDLAFAGGGQFGGDREIVGRPNGLFRNLGRWQFVPVEDSALTAPDDFTFGWGVGDYNGDGFADVALSGFDATRVFLNRGDGSFLLSITLPDTSFGTSLGWADLDGDGYVDLYVTRYVDWSWENHPACKGADDRLDVCPPRQFNGLNDRFFRNDGQGGFVAAHEQAGLLPGGKGLGVLAADIDQDGDTDLYVANDTTANWLYLNDGNGHCAERGLQMGVAVDDRAIPNGSMGVDLIDFNLDGWSDLWVSNYEHESHALYRNDGPERGFQYSTRETGVSAVGQLYVGFGTRSSDFDGDGDGDLIVTNGHVIQTARLSPILQQPLVLENTGGRFRKVQFPLEDYLGQSHLGRGLAIGDLDGDRDDDVAITHNNAPVAILENRVIDSPLIQRVRLTGAVFNRDAIGATVFVSTSSSRRVFPIMGSNSYLSVSSRDLALWRVANQQSIDIEVLWPNGRQTKHNLQCADYSVVVEPLAE